MAKDDRSAKRYLSLKSITRGATFFVTGKLISDVLEFFVNLLLTRGLGSSLYGVYSYGRTFFFIISKVSHLGTGKSVLRFLPEYEESRSQQNAVIALAYLTAIAGSCVIGLVLYSLAPMITALTLENHLLTSVLQIFAILLPFNTLANLTNSVFRGLEKLEYQVAVDNIISPVIRLLLIGVALILGYSLIGIMAAIVVATVLVFVVAIFFFYTKTSLQPDFKQPYQQRRRFYNYSFPLTLKDLGSVVVQRVDILMVGLFLTESSVGIYNIAVLLAGFLVLPLGAFNQIFPPVASRHYSNGEINELESVYTTITRWTFTLALILAITMMIYRVEILAIFGEEFTGGATVLLLFSIAQLINCAIGPSGYLLMMTDHQYVTLGNQWLLGLLNVILNYVFILQFGLIGAALATVTVLILMNILKISEVWWLERLFPYSLQFWKPISAAIGAAIVMIGWTFILGGYTLLFVGSLSGAISYTVLLYFFGLETEDREFFKETLAEYT